LAGLSAGSFTLTERRETGWRAVSPESTTVVLQASGDCLTVDFWNERASASPAATPRR
jgi:hypothetical protein